jgi:uncharacterized delta-60 repeat protein
VLVVAAGAVAAGVLLLGDDDAGPPEGTLEVAGRADERIYDVAGSADGALYVAGRFTEIDGVAAERVARVDGDGRVDPAFDTSRGADDWVFAVAPAADGGAWIGGAFSTYGGEPAGGVARLRPDGSLDPAFTTGAGADDAVLALAPAADGGVWIGGAFSTYDGEPAPGIARLGPDGSLDPSFDPGDGPDLPVYDLEEAPDGSVYVAGAFARVDGTPAQRIVRLGADGRVDADFDTSAGPNRSVADVELAGDGVLIAGNFSTVGGANARGVARLLADGSLDPDFDSSVGTDDEALALALTEDGGVYLVGNFSTYDGVETGRLVRIRPDGRIDNDFDTGGGTNDWIAGVALTEDGRVLIGGSFTRYGGEASTRLAVLG